MRGFGQRRVIRLVVGLALSLILRNTDITA
jgi:hypothetical protein